MNGQDLIEQCAAVVESYGSEGDRTAKEYAHETAAELAARIRALKPSAPSADARTGKPPELPEWLDVELLGIEDAKEEDTWSLSVPALRFLLERFFQSAKS